MSVKVEQLKAIEKEIDLLINESENNLIHYSSDYLKFLSCAIPNVEVLCFTYRLNNCLISFLPIVIKTDSKLGTVVNSLPYFGSHGGVITDTNYSRSFPESANEEIPGALLLSLKDYCQSKNVASLTVIDNLFAPTNKKAYTSIGLKAVDFRIGQYTNLPDRTTINTEEELFSIFHVKTRNAIRKGQKYVDRILESHDEDTIVWLQKIHNMSISSMGGIVKPLDHFIMMRNIFSNNFRVYVAENNGVKVAGILILLYKNTIEYFTPVVETDFKDKQVLSALIFEIMITLSKEGYKIWNWGGTWPTQDGVYRFKSRWGAQDRNYSYYNLVMDKSILNLDKSLLLKAFPNFYLFKY